MALSFPYPEQGGTARAKGQGCMSCVHRGYCPALYWFMRSGEREPDDYNGIRCLSWSNDLADQVKSDPTTDDEETEAYIYNQAIGSEANRNGITSPVTGSNRK